MGKFHPHGDQAIYDALVRLAQDFSSRYPLVDGQGNFGNIDGDNAAAYRYTEARMTEVARLLLDGIDEDAVDFRPNYNGQTEEPVVLPGGFPNLLANGAQGIAVGMATSIPPHNAAELCDAALHLIDNPDAKSKPLLKFVQGPDFPTGGIIVDAKEAIAEAYSTGRGSFRVRARWKKEEGARGTWVVVVTEIPWLVPKSRLIEKIAELLQREEAAAARRRPRRIGRGHPHRARAAARTVDPELLMESLFRLTELESRIPLNLNVLTGGKVPKVRGPCRVPARMARPSARGAGAPLQLPLGADRAPARDPRRLADRLSEPRQGDQDHPHRGRAEAGADRRFKLTEIQANAILNMRLRSLAQARGDGDQDARTRTSATS